MNKFLTPLKIIFKDNFYKYTAAITTIAVAYLSYWLLYRTTTFEHFFEDMTNGAFGQLSLLYGIAYIAATILTILLSGLSVSTMVWLYRNSRLSQARNFGANIGGLVVAAFSMGCPVCGAFLLSAIGVAGGLSVFPLQGLELKILSLVLLAGSLVYGVSKVNAAIHCRECNDISHQIAGNEKRTGIILIPLKNILVFSLAGLFFLNQLLLSQIAAGFGMTSQKGFMASLLGIQTKSSYTIIAPKVNPDGKTTSLFEWPTITEVPANPHSGNHMADAKVVMIAAGKPFYAPDDISFDDPVNAQKKWGIYETSIKLQTEEEKRYQKMISTMMTCSYCCGSANRVTMVKNCGCAHAKAARGFYRYMLQTYGSKYTDEQLVGESHRWYALWYPKGMLEDYLLAIGNETALPHTSHGGAGSDGRHGIAK